METVFFVRVLIPPGVLPWDVLFQDFIFEVAHCLGGYGVGGGVGFGSLRVPDVEWIGSYVL